MSYISEAFHRWFWSRRKQDPKMYATIMEENAYTAGFIDALHEVLAKAQWDNGKYTVSEFVIEEMLQNK